MITRVHDVICAYLDQCIFYLLIRSGVDMRIEKPSAPTQWTMLLTSSIVHVEKIYIHVPVKYFLLLNVIFIFFKIYVLCMNEE